MTQPAVTAILVALLLSGCDQYKNLSGTTRVNEITVYGNVPCVMAVGENGALAISCDWSRHHQSAVPN